MYLFKFKSTHRWQSDPNSHYLIIYTQSRLHNLRDPVNCKHKPEGREGPQRTDDSENCKTCSIPRPERWGAPAEWPFGAAPQVLWPCRTSNQGQPSPHPWPGHQWPGGQWWGTTPFLPYQSHYTHRHKLTETHTQPSHCPEWHTPRITRSWARQCWSS